ncbi:MAG TPA: flavodoxin domain-containing protein [bacterium]|nr:flavodoxin domain-containing protein [bacterium]
MRVLIAYRSKYGGTEACARALAERIQGDTVLADLRRRPLPQPRSFDVVLVGGSIYGGRIQREVTWFCESHEEDLLSRPLGLFICCFYTGERAQTQIREAFPESLYNHAFGRAHLGGTLHPASLGLLDRFLVRSLGSPPGDVNRTRAEEIEALARATVQAGAVPAGRSAPR